MNQDLSGRITAFLDLHHVMSLATCGPEGPHAASLFYVRDGLSLCWVSEAETRHSRDLEAHPLVAATVAPNYTDFAAIRGVQMHGEARRLADMVHRARVLFLMARRYPFLGRLAEGPAALRAAYERTQVYRLTPAEIVLIDNTKGFGHKETLAL